MENKNILATIHEEVNRELANKEVLATLVQTTFKGLTAENARQAIIEGMVRGFTFKDFLEKNIYAIKFGDGYSLVTSIDNSRKIGMRSGIVGTDAPIYTYDDEGKVESCSVTVKKMINGYVGEFTALVFFDEYYKPGKTYNGKYTPSLWDTKRRTMIAKVAEMHALRKACPEELAQSYVEEEIGREEALKVVDEENSAEQWKDKISKSESIAELSKNWSDTPIQYKKELESLKDEMKNNLIEKK